MKRLNFLCLILLVVFSSACDTDDHPWGDWEKSDAYPGDNRVGAVSFQYGETVYVGMGFNNALSTADKHLRNFYKCTVDANGELNWKSVPDLFPAAGRKGSVAFVIGDIAYVGAGWRARSVGGNNDKLDTYFSSFYKFDLKTDKWMLNDDKTPQMTDIVQDSEPKIVADDSVSSQFWSGIAFELNGKGYVGTGNVDGRVSKSIFTYTPETGKWSNSTMKGDPRTGAVVFKIGEKVVVCLGSTNTAGTSYNKGVYTFDGNAENKWEEKLPLVNAIGDFNNNYNSIPRSYAVAFTSNLDYADCGYIAGGLGANTVWRYDLSQDRWHIVEEFAPSMGDKVGAIGFSLNQYGYVTTGGSGINSANNNSTWKFVPAVDEYDGNDE